MLTTVLALAAAAQGAPAAPATETDRLARRLALASGLVGMAPMLIDKDLADLAAEQPDLTATEKRRLTEIGQAEGRRNVERLTDAIARGYAERLTAAELQVLVAQAESAPAKKLRTIQPAVIGGAIAGLGDADLKKTTAAAFCKETGKLCTRQ